MSDKTHTINLVKPKFRIRDYLFGIKRVVGVYCDPFPSENETSDAIACIVRDRGKECHVESVEHFQITKDRSMGGQSYTFTFATVNGCIPKFGLPAIVFYDDIERICVAANREHSLASNLGTFLQVNKADFSERTADAKFCGTEMEVAWLSNKEIGIIEKLCRVANLRLLACVPYLYATAQYDHASYSQEIIRAISECRVNERSEFIRKINRAVNAATQNLGALSRPIKPKFPKVKKEERVEEKPSVSTSVPWDVLRRELDGDEEDSQGNGAASRIDPESEETVADVNINPDFPDVDLLVDTRDLEGKENTDEFGEVKEEGKKEGDESLKPKKE